MAQALDIETHDLSPLIGCFGFYLWGQIAGALLTAPDANT
jgi:hypothetical protein